MILTPYRLRAPLLALLLLPPIYILLFHLRPAYQNNGFDFHRPDYHDLADYPYPTDTSRTVNLIVASTKKDDISWTTALRIPNLRVIRYVSDDEEAEYRPRVLDKGREALMYFTYLYDFYEEEEGLADVNLFVHAEEHAWHVDPALRQSMVFALSRLDLEEVEKRGYWNLRLSWKDACPDWINTTKTVEESIKQEEPWMKQAWRENFGEEEEVPEILAGPCCSQFAVTKEVIRGRPREQYKRSMDWLINTSWSDYIAGRVWEHMWPHLFTSHSRDCVPEVRGFCRMYGICFESAQELGRYNTVWDMREQWRESTEFGREIWRPGRAALAREKMGKYSEWLERKLEEAVTRGRDEKTRKEAWRDTKEWVPG